MQIFHASKAEIGAARIKKPKFAADYIEADEGLEQSLSHLELDAYVVIIVLLAHREIPMTITAAHVSPLIALIAGILILIMPRLLNYIVAIYLILVGIMGLNAIHHFIH